MKYKISYTRNIEFEIDLDDEELEELQEDLKDGCYEELGMYANTAWCSTNQCGFRDSYSKIKIRKIKK